MTTRIELDYDWAEEQQEQWETLASENKKSLDDWTESHLDWLDAHSTISDLLAWKRPFKKLKTTTTTTTEEKKVEPKPKSLKAVIHIPMFDENSFVKDDQDDQVNDCEQPEEKDKVEKENVSVTSTYHDMNDDQIVSNSQPKDNEMQQVTTESNDEQAIPSNANKEFVQQNTSATKIKSSISAATISNKITIDKEAEDDEQAFQGVAMQLSRQKKEELCEVENNDNGNTTRKDSLDDDNNVVPMDIEKTTPSISSPSRQITHEEITAEVKGYVSPNRATYTPRRITVEKYYQESPKNTPELTMDIDTTNTSSSQPIKTPDIQQQEVTSNDTQMAGSTPQERIPNSKSPQYEDDDDEIQLVVSTRTPPQQEKKSPASPDRPTTPKPITPISSTNTLPQPTPRYKSPFMAKLFQMGNRTSLKEDAPAPTNFITARPKGSMSTSSIRSEISNSRSMSLLESKVDRKRSLVSVPEPVLVPEEIQVSDSVPGETYKKFKTVALKQSKTPSVTSTRKNIPTPSSSSVSSKRSVNSTKTVGSKKDGEEDEQEEEPKYIIPSWAKNPELESLLIKQSGLDPDAIFGRSAPLQLKDIFAGPFL